MAKFSERGAPRHGNSGSGIAGEAGKVVEDVVQELTPAEAKAASRKHGDRIINIIGVIGGIVIAWLLWLYSRTT
tara:strand:- start:636 stop:857 length:222 start_codon:yes stop_codon:yes gene_type:complete